MKTYIGTIKQNATDELDKIAGVKLIIVTELPFQNQEEALILHPTTIEDFEKFYKHSFEIMGKEMISDDYKIFLKYILDSDCEITAETTINNFKDLIEFTKEDDERCFKALSEFKKRHLLEE